MSTFAETRDNLWKLIEKYRMSGGREEHWANKDTLDVAIEDALRDSDVAQWFAEWEQIIPKDAREAFPRGYK